ncbi:bestrophin-like domain [Streptomyces puniciscabiei]
MFSWVYSLPNFAAFLIFLCSFVCFAVVGALLVRPQVKEHFKKEADWRTLVVLAIQMTVGFYGMLMALIVLSTYQNFVAAREKVSQEASALGTLYRDVSSYPEPPRRDLQQELINYTRYVINEAWPAQKRGVIPIEGVQRTNKFQSDLLSFRPANLAETSLSNVTLSQFGTFTEARRQRINAVGLGVSGVLWVVLTLGILIIIGLTWLLPVEHLRVHLMISSIFAIVVSMVFFSTVVMDDPFRGDVSVSSRPFQILLQTVMR